ncbi:hypothetical protein FNB79_09820 [Formosa sediminum]|uniref:ADP ribosyltransferase domain-containing protein n=1 Tax=Formosa sediminum TaxID=2594004 RepID=A0A516GRW1_9FLAO|nr:ADP-ribosyltransferase [Formosa sediminum]QDO94255.1 hypothetical protein FNB79_09820 [Formosa sediminum]
MITKKKIERKIFNSFSELLINRWIENHIVKTDFKYFDLKTDKTIPLWTDVHNQYFTNILEKKDNLKATEEEINIIDSFDNYQGEIFRHINKKLRGIGSYTAGFDNKLNKHICHLNKTINSFDVSENIIVARRSKSFLFNGKKKLSIIKDYGFLSTSINISHRKDSDGNNSDFEKDALLILKVPKFSKAIYCEKAQKESKRRTEFELLIQKGSTILIEKNYKILSNRLIFGSIQQAD